MYEIIKDNWSLSFVALYHDSGMHETLNIPRKYMLELLSVYDFE